MNYSKPTMRRRTFCVALGSGSFAGCLRLQEADEATSSSSEDGTDSDDGPEFNLAEAWTLDKRVRNPFVHDGQFVGHHDGTITIVSLDGEVVFESGISSSDDYSLYPRRGDNFATNDKSAFFHYTNHNDYDDNDDHIHAFNTDTGEHQWKYQTTQPTIQSIVATDDAVYYGGRNVNNGELSAIIEAIDSDTGDQIWKREVDRNRFAGLRIDGSTLYVGQGGFRALDRATGETLTEYNIPELVRGVNSGPDDRSLYISSDRKMFQFDLDDREVRKTVELDGEIPVPAFGTDTVYSGHSAGWVTAYDLEDGTELWQQRLEGATDQVTVDSGLLWVNSDEGTVTTLDPENGRQLEQFDDAGNAAVFDGHVVFSRDKLQAYDVEHR